MKIFVTGASGFIGFPVVSDLIQAGHQVAALARSEESARKILSLDPKIDIVRGNLEDLDTLSKAAANSDGVIHLGFIHEFDRYDECCEIDRIANLAMLKAIERTDKPFIYANGTFMLPDGKISDEEQRRDPSVHNLRGETEEIVLAHKDKGVRAMVIRLAATVHGKGEQAFIPILIEIAKSRKVSGYIGTGQNVWPAVHRLDAARLFNLALIRGSAGSVYHGVAEQGVKIRDIAQAIGASLNLPVVPIDPEEASTHFGSLATFLVRDTPLSSEKTRAQLGWEPRELNLLDDMRLNYF